MIICRTGLVHVSEVLISFNFQQYLEIRHVEHRSISCLTAVLEHTLYLARSVMFSSKTLRNICALDSVLRWVLDVLVAYQLKTRLVSRGVRTFLSGSVQKAQIKSTCRRLLLLEWPKSRRFLALQDPALLQALVLQSPIVRSDRHSNTFF